MTDPVTGSERRGNPELRSIFIEAYDIIRPFFDPANSWGGQTHEHLAYRALHEHFPTMSAQDVFVIVAAGKRVFTTTGTPTP
jgi:hypothetical protein